MNWLLTWRNKTKEVELEIEKIYTREGSGQVAKGSLHFSVWAGHFDLNDL